MDGRFLVPREDEDGDGDEDADEYEYAKLMCVHHSDG